MRDRNQKGKKAFALAMISMVVVVGGGLAAFAYHGDCPPGINLTPGTGFETYVSTASTSNSQSVCTEVADPSPTGSCNTFCAGVTVTVTDPQPTREGRSIEVEAGARELGGHNVDDTGVEGPAQGCGTGGACVSGGTLYADGIATTPIANKTGVDENVVFPVVTQGTTSAHNIVCVSGTCARSVKVAAGNVAVYANSSAPVATVPLCVSVGPGFSCP